MLFIFYGGPENILWAVPSSFLDLGEIPGMAFAARQVTSGLVDGEIVFRTRQMNGADQAVEPFLILLQGDLAGWFTAVAVTDGTTTGGKALGFEFA